MKDSDLEILLRVTKEDGAEGVEGSYVCVPLKTRYNATVT